MVAQLRLGIAGAGASDFATDPIPVLTATKTPTGELLSVRSVINPVQTISRGNWGTLARAATAYGAKLAWDCVAVFTTAEKEQFEDLAQWDRENIATGLRLIDEVEALAPRISALKVLLSGTRYGVFRVGVTLERGNIAPFGRPSEGLWVVRWQMEEL